MITYKTITIPEPLYARAKELAQTSQQDIATVIAEALEQSLPPLKGKKNELTDDVIAREQAAYRRLHPSLLAQYAGEYVAIHQGKLVGHDVDQVALLLNVKKQFPGEFVWIAPVLQEPEEVYIIHSPRLVADK